MADLDVIEQKPVAMTELKEKLDAIKKTKNELNFRADKVYAYLEELSESKKDVKEMHKKLSGLGIQKLRDRHIVKILDLMPEDAESLKILFSGESIALKQEEMKQILDVVNG